jgi:succinate-acetate transporter protein
MSTHGEDVRAGASTRAAVEAEGWRDGFARPQVFLQPIAAPSILGLFGFSAATMMVAANLAGWYGNASSPLVIFPFAMIFGGIAQLLAGMWAYRARDAIATAIHGTWGSFWIAYGILQSLVLFHHLPPIPKGGVSHELAFWFIMLAAITLSGALACLAENPGLFTVLGPLAGGSGCLAVGYWIGSSGWITAGGWVLAFSAGFAWYIATAMMMVGASGRTILPTGKPKATALRPGAKQMEAIELPWAEPGIKQGQ